MLIHHVMIMMSCVELSKRPVDIAPKAVILASAT